MDTKQFANRAFGAGHGRNIFDLKQHLRESKGVMLTSRCFDKLQETRTKWSTPWSAATCRRFGLRAAWRRILRNSEPRRSRDKLRPTKALTSQRTPKLPDIRCKRLQPNKLSKK